MTISLQDQTVVVTGGAHRLGRAIAIECTRAGASVVITYNRSGEAAQGVVEELRHISSTRNADTENRFAAFQLEVSDAGAVAQFKNRVLEEMGSVSALVNNAAIFRRTPFSQMTESDFDEHIAANLKGPYLLSKAFGGHFYGARSRLDCQYRRYSRLEAAENYIPYCVSKAGVVMLTQALAKSAGAICTRQLHLSRHDFAAVRIAKRGMLAMKMSTRTMKRC
jgi:NAD(P)-dependent dehydrogenase (short-subunit alcohol dehydrogenase family)